MYFFQRVRVGFGESDWYALQEAARSEGTSVPALIAYAAIAYARRINGH